MGAQDQFRLTPTYEAFFTQHQAPLPALSFVEVARLPKDVKIEIEAIAVRR
ncbi:MAG: Rid family hydrolase [Symbiopectobacterium sp.]